MSHKCLACGGPVNTAGMFEGGEVGDGDFDNDGDIDRHIEPGDTSNADVNQDGESTQMQQSEDMEHEARKAFVAAVRRIGGRI